MSIVRYNELNRVFCLHNSFRLITIQPDFFIFKHVDIFISGAKHFETYPRPRHPPIRLSKERNNRRKLPKKTMFVVISVTQQNASIWLEHEVSHLAQEEEASFPAVLEHVRSILTHLQQDNMFFLRGNISVDDDYDWQQHLATASSRMLKGSTPTTTGPLYVADYRMLLCMPSSRVATVAHVPPGPWSAWHTGHEWPCHSIDTRTTQSRTGSHLFGDE